MSTDSLVLEHTELDVYIKRNSKLSDLELKPLKQRKCRIKDRLTGLAENGDAVAIAYAAERAWTVKVPKLMAA